MILIRWPGIRADFRRHLGEGLNQEFRAAYLSVPSDVANAIAADRKRGDELLGEVRQVSKWVKEKELKANVAGLYGVVNDVTTNVANRPDGAKADSRG